LRQQLQIERMTAAIGAEGADQRRAGERERISIRVRRLGDGPDRAA